MAQHSRGIIENVIKQNLEDFKAAQFTLLSKTELLAKELEDQTKLAQLELNEKISNLENQLETQATNAQKGLSHREALKQTITAFKLFQSEISRKTQELEGKGRGRKVSPDQLARYLSGRKDVNSETLEMIIRALPREGQLMFFSLVFQQLSREN